MSAPGTLQPASPWTAVIPFYNEKDYLPRTLRSLCEQSLQPAQVILVDNASTDGSAALARVILKDYPQINALIIDEPRPGRTQAMQCGLNAVTTPLVATCDADTWYPPDYLATAADLFATHPEAASVMAIDIYADPQSWKARLKRIKTRLVSSILPRQCHTGAYGHMFRTEIVRHCGGFDPRIWPYVMEDHELAHRVLKAGPSLYRLNLWCMPSQRRTNASAVCWKLGERVLYHLTPWALKDWFFYRFLAARLHKRRLNNMALRERNWA